MGRQNGRRGVRACVNLVLAVWAMAAMGAAARGQTCDRVLGVSAEGVSWATPSAHPGPAEVTSAASWDPDGSGPLAPWLVIAGSFDRAGDTPVSNIAAWDGTSWHALGSGVNGRVKGLAVQGGRLFVGGDFTSAGGIAGTALLARWTGGAWEPGIVQSGNTPVVWDAASRMLGIAGDGSRVFFWGYFPGHGSYSDELFSTDGTDVSDRGCDFHVFQSLSVDCPPGQVQAAEPRGGDLMVLCGGGLAYPPAGSAVGFSNDPFNGYDWHEVAGGATFTSTCIRAINGQRWVGGRATDGTPILTKTYLASPSPFNIIGLTRVSIPSAGQGSVTAMVQRGTGGSSAAVAVGYINGGTGEITTGVYDLTATANPTLTGSSIFNGRVDDLIELNGFLYAVGRFTQVGLRVCRGVAKFDGSTWSPLVGASVDVYPYALASFNSDLWAGGAFGTIGGANIPYLAKLSNGIWQPITTPGPNQPVTAMRYYAPNPVTVVGAGMVVGGDFGAIAQTTASHIAFYSYTGGILSVLPMGAGLNAAPRAMQNVSVTVAHDDLIVGGDFTFTGATALNHIGRWTGTAWQPLGGGTNGNVLALTLLSGQLIAGGEFTTAGGVANPHVAAWNGSVWAPMGAGLNGAVRSLVVYNGSLYSGGDFTASGATGLAGFAKWNGSAWVSAGVGFNGSVNAMRLVDTDLLIGGSFVDSFPGPVHLNRLGLFNGTAMRPIQQGLGNTVVALAQVDADVFVSSMDPPFVFRAAPATTPSVDAYAASSACLEKANVFQALAANCAGGQFHWRRNGATLSDGVVTAGGGIAIGANTSQLLFYPGDASDAGTFDCQVVCPCGNAVSDPIAVTFGTPVRILAQPVAGSFCIGGEQQLAIIADGTPPLRYTWYRGTTIVATTSSAILTLPAQSAADAGTYTCEVSNFCGTVTSQPALRTAVQPPTVSSGGQPSNRTVCAGGTATFSVSAANAADASYRWFRNNIPLIDHAASASGGSVSGTSTPTLTLAQITAADMGYYACHITTGCTGESDQALLTVSAGGCCAADFNGVGGLTVQDIFDFLNAWFSGNQRADFNHSGGLSVQDVFDYLGAWFAGC